MLASLMARYLAESGALSGSELTGSSVDIGRGIGDVLDVAVDVLPAVAMAECAGVSFLSRRS